MDESISQNDEMREIIDDFIAESIELIEKVVQDIVEIEKNPDDEIINGIFRAVHTIKGTSSFLGFNTLSKLSHKAEDVLGRIRKKEMIPDGDIADTSSDYIQSFKSEVMTVCKSEINDWKANPNYAATLSDFLGEPNTRENGKRIEERIVSALTSNNVVRREDLQVKVVPVNIHQVLIMIRIDAVSTPQNSLEVGEPVTVSLIYDSTENNIFFMPINQTDRMRRGY